MINFDLKNRVAVVTGGAQGFGLAITERFIASGASVVIWDIDEEAIKTATKKINSDKVSYQIVDVGNYENIEKNLAEIEKTHKKIDIFINNAGVAGKNTTVVDYPLDEWKKVIDLNLNAVFYCCKAVTPYMIKNNYGRIVNITSGAPLNCFKEYSIYSSTKASLNSATITASKEINDKNITINLVSPGPIKTNMTSGMKVKFFSMDQAIKDITKLVSKENKINGKFIWRGKIIPIFPNLKGINWLKGKATKNYKKI